MGASSNLSTLYLGGDFAKQIWLPDAFVRNGKSLSAHLSMSTTQLAERFGAVSMTLEMPFKDNEKLPDPIYGWSPQRSKYLASACLDALHAILPELEAERKSASRAA